MADQTQRIIIMFTSQGAKQVASDIAGVGNAAEGAGSALSGLVGTLAAGIVTGGTLAEIAHLSDEYTIFQNKVDSVNDSQQAQQSTMADLTAVAQTTRSALGDVANTYQTLKLATDQYGLSNAAQIALTQELLEAYTIQTGDTANAAEATRALSIALQEGTISGRQFRTLIGDQPSLMQAFAKATGYSVDELKQLGAEGKISGNDLIVGLAGAADTIQNKFDGVIPTINSEWQNVRNTLADVSHELKGLFDTPLKELNVFLTSFDNGLKIINAGLKSLNDTAQSADAFIPDGAGGGVYLSTGTDQPPTDAQRAQFNAQQQPQRPQQILPAPNSLSNNIAGQGVNQSFAPSNDEVIKLNEAIAAMRSQNLLLSDQSTMSASEYAQAELTANLRKQGLVTQDEMNHLLSTQGGLSQVHAEHLSVIDQKTYDAQQGLTATIALQKEQAGYVNQLGLNQAAFNEQIAVLNTLLDGTVDQQQKVLEAQNKITAAHLLTSPSTSSATQAGGLLVQNAQNDHRDIAQDMVDSWQQAGGAAKDYNDTLVAINANVNAGVISQVQGAQQIQNAYIKLGETQTGVVNGLQLGWAQVDQTVHDSATQSAKVVTDAYQQMTTAVDNFVTTGKFEWQNITNAILNDLTTLLTNQALAYLIDGSGGQGSNGGLLGGIVGGLGGLFGSLAGVGSLAGGAGAGASLGDGFVSPGLQGFGSGGAFSGALAGGGIVTAGNAYLVGERGPEMYVPQQSGTIVPNGAMNAAQQRPVVNVSIGLTEDAVAGAMNSAAGEKIIISKLTKNKRIVQRIAS
jgi:lambda family phage tail tape measure protein